MKMTLVLAFGALLLAGFARLALTTRAHIPPPAHLRGGDPSACGMASPAKLFSLQSAVRSHRVSAHKEVSSDVLP